MREELVRRYGIDPVFFSRYFERNAERRFAAQTLEFMLWRRGAFIQPRHRDAARERFLREEVENFYERGQCVLPQIQFAVTTRCTLRCRDCNALIPYFGGTAPHRDLDPDDFARDLAALAGAVTSIRRFMLLGGEPLLHPGFPDILAAAAAEKAVEIVEIVTNGTLVPGDAVLRVAEAYSHKVYFHISNYAVNPELAPRLRHEAVHAALEARGIRRQMASNPSWSREVPLAGRNGDDGRVREQFAGCWTKRTLEVKNGVIAICPKASSGYELGMADGSVAGETVNLREGGDIRRKLIDFYHRDFFEVCRACVKIDEDVVPAEQMQPRSGHEPESGISARQNPCARGERRTGGERPGGPEKPPA